MKKTALMLLSAIFIATLWTGTAFAEGSTTATTATPVTAPATTVTPASTTVTDKTVTIAPDNILYSLKRLVESIQVALTYSPEGKAELLVTLAEERLAEAELMSEKNKQELAEHVMRAYAKTVDTANEKLEEAAENGKDVTAVLGNITIVEQTAGKLAIKVTGILPAEFSETLKTQVADQVKRTLAVQAFAIAKNDYKDSNAAVKTANKELKAAEKSGDVALVTAAKEKLKLALQAKTNAEKLKDEVEAYKDDIIKDIKDEGDEDKNENDGDNEDKLGRQEELQRKIAKMEEIVAKLKLKRSEQIEKHKDQHGKASEKIEENTNKQLKKKNIKMDKMKEELKKMQTAATSDQALKAAVQSASKSSTAIDRKDKNDEDENADEDDDNDEDKNKDREKSGNKDK